MKKKLLSCMAVLFLVFMIIPAYSASAAVFNIDFETKSKGIYLANLDTDTVVYEKDADLRLEPASCTKIMTYIVAVEHISDLEGTKITVSDYIEPALTGTGSSMAGVITGEELTALQLLNLMMVPSGNDASLVLAEYVGGLETGAAGEEDRLLSACGGSDRRRPKRPGGDACLRGSSRRHRHLPGAGDHRRPGLRVPGAAGL